MADSASPIDNGISGMANPIWAIRGVLSGMALKGEDTAVFHLGGAPGGDCVIEETPNGSKVVHI